MVRWIPAFLLVGFPYGIDPTSFCLTNKSEMDPQMCRWARLAFGLKMVPQTVSKRRGPTKVLVFVVCLEDQKRGPTTKECFAKGKCLVDGVFPQVSSGCCLGLIVQGATKKRRKKHGRTACVWGASPIWRQAARKSMCDLSFSHPRLHPL